MWLKQNLIFFLLELEWVVVMLKLARWELLPISLLTSAGGRERDSPGAKLIIYVLRGVNRSGGAISRHLRGGLMQSCRSSCSLLSLGWIDPRPQALVSDSTAVFELF